MQFIESWKNAVLNPKEFFSKAAEKTDGFGEGAKWIGISGLITGLITAAVSFSKIGLMGATLATLGAIVGALIATIVFTGILWLIARVFGGTGEFSRQYYGYAGFTAPLGIASAVVALIPTVGTIAGIIIGLYSLYLTWLLIKMIHGLSSLKAILVILIPIIVIAVIVAAVGVAILGSMGLAAFGGS